MAGHILMVAMAVVCLSCSASFASVPEMDEDILVRGAKGERRWAKLFADVDEMENQLAEFEAKLAVVHQILSESRTAGTCPRVPGIMHTKLPNHRLPALGLNEQIKVVCEPGYETHDGLKAYNAHCGEQGHWSRTDPCLKQRTCNQNEKYLSETGKGYRLFNQESTVEEARQACSADGGELAYPVTPKVLWHLIGMSNDNGLKNTYLEIAKPAGANYWSYPDGSQAKNIPWCADEPSSHANEYCVESFENSRCLNNARCDLKRRFLCQYDCVTDETDETNAPATLGGPHHDRPQTDETDEPNAPATLGNHHPNRPQANENDETGNSHPHPPHKHKH